MKATNDKELRQRKKPTAVHPEKSDKTNLNNNSNNNNTSTTSTDVKSTTPTALPESKWNQADVLCGFVLLFSAAFLRFKHIAHPRGIVFDETHFTKFATWYHSQHYFVDIHPPLAKLLHALVLRFCEFFPANEENPRWWTKEGFVGTVDFELLYNNPEMAYVPLRRTTAVFGVFLVVLCFVCARCVGCGTFAAFFGAWLVLCDNLITLQSRLILTDAFLFFFITCTIACSFSTTKFSVLNSQKNERKYALFMIALTGAMLGCALSVKLTALGCVGFVAVHQCIHVLDLTQQLPKSSPIHRKQFKNSSNSSNSSVIFFVLGELCLRGFLMLFVCLSVFLFFWVLHIYALPFNGQGTAFMKPEFQRTLIAKPKLGNIVHPALANNFYSMPLPTKLHHVITTTWWINQGGGALLEHVAKSRWYQWPLHNCKVIEFFSQGNERIRGIGNVVGWWIVALCVILSILFVFAFKSKTNNKTFFTLVALIVGYFGNLLPYILIERATWNYHYIPALLFGVQLTAVITELSISFVNKTFSSLFPKIFIFAIFLGIMGLVGWTFHFFSPLTFGFDISPEERALRKWWFEWDL